jgi:hypothetical protein
MGFPTQKGGRGTAPRQSFDQFSAAIDLQWIVDALAAIYTASVRRRTLPDEHVVWLVIGMGLSRARAGLLTHREGSPPDFYGPGNAAGTLSCRGPARR